jgi:hypothetical protein
MSYDGAYQEAEFVELPADEADEDDASLVSLATFAPGLYEDVPTALYHRRELGVASKTALDYVADTLADYYAWVTGALPDRETKALGFGKAFHCACLEPERFAREYVVSENFGRLLKHDASGTTTEQGRENKKRRDAWLAEHHGKVVLSAGQGEMLRGMSAALRDTKRHSKATKLLAEGVSESTIRWDDRESGLVAKGRTDWRTTIDGMRVVADLKSAEDASQRAFVRDAERHGYGRQAPMYRDGLEAVGHGADVFVFIVCQKTPPYNVGVYSVENEHTGREANRILMGRLAEALATDTWPGLRDAVVPVRVRSWV